MEQKRTNSPLRVHVPLAANLAASHLLLGALLALAPGILSTLVMPVSA